MIGRYDENNVIETEYLEPDMTVTIITATTIYELLTLGHSLGTLLLTILSKHTFIDVRR